MKVVNINAVKRCSRCGGSKPLTGRLDRTGECGCADLALRVFDDMQHADKRAEREQRAEVQRKARNGL